MQLRLQFWLDDVAPVVGFSVLPLVVSPLAMSWAFSPQWLVSEIGFWLMQLDLLWVPCVLAAVVFVVIAPVLLWLRSWRAWAACRLLWALVFLPCWYEGQKLSIANWRAALDRTIERSEPLIQAILDFERQHGRPPASLGELVPEFIPEVPTTGIGGHPRYRYVVGQPERYDGNPWALVVTPPQLIMGFDTFLYLPRQNYPRFGYGGSLQRIGTWAYVHE